MKQTKLIFASISIAVMMSFCVSILPTTTTYAASSTATKICENAGGAGDKEACANAYDTAYKSGTKAANCSSKSGKEKTACEIGAKAGLAAFQATVKQTGKAGADAGTKQSTTCKKYNVSTNKKICEKAWAAQTIVKAKAIGKAAKSEDECKNLLGGSKAVSACKAEYKKAKNAAAVKAKEDCAGVSTFFDFGCSGSDAKKGGRENPIVSLMLTVLSWATGVVALATVGAIIYGGILYTTAQDNSAQTQKGIMYVVDSVIGLILWLSAYVLINFIVPGGLFN